MRGAQFRSDPRQRHVAIRMRKVAHPHRRDTERRLASLAEDIDRQVPLANIDQHALAQAQVSHRPTVQRGAMLRPRFAVDITEHHPRQTTPRQSAGVVAGMDCPVQRVHCETRPEPTS